MAPFDQSAAYEEQSATILAAQPPTLPELMRNPDEDWDVEFSHFESRLTALRSWRWSFWSHWMILGEYFLPRRRRAFVASNNMSRGRPMNEMIVDSDPLRAVRICAAGMTSGLTNPTRRWFKIGVDPMFGDLDAEAKAWLEHTENLTYSVLAGSNYYNMRAQSFKDVTVFGTAPMMIYEDAETVIRAYLPVAGEYFVAQGSRLSIDTLYEEFTLTVAQAIERFQLKSCPSQIANLWETGGGSLENEFVIGHAIEPNFDLSGRGRKRGKTVTVVPGSFPYREVYWLKGVKTDRPLSRRGFHERPFTCARWEIVPDAAYGYSPCMDVLGDNKQIQQETRRKAEFIEKGVRPPMGADPSMKNEPSSIMPGMITYTNADSSKKGFWPLFEPNPQWLPALTTDIAGVSARINKGLYVDIFQAITNMDGVQPRNELELTKRDLERLQQLGPVITLFETECAGPDIERVVNILQRRRMLKPLPDSLKRIPLKINFISLMRLAQSSAESVAMRDVLQTMGSLSAAAQSAGLPNPLRVIDLDASARKYAEVNQYPASCVLTIQQVADHDQLRVQEMQKKQQQQAVVPTTVAAAGAAKTLASTPLNNGSALDAILGGAGGLPK